ncbi:MAG: tyrosine-type recombinase/integrase [Saprospiraceae bacterium]|nr:tyrosine-type recombinase/integrase [Saprospiraceae bacterium]
MQAIRCPIKVSMKESKSCSKKANIDKPVGLHGLRHSIATHLLHQGMKLTDIARFWDMPP